MRIPILSLLIWTFGYVHVSAQGEISSPADTLWIFMPASDSLQTDSIVMRAMVRATDSSSPYDVEIPEFQYKSPEAAAFKKYGDYQVSEYTGSANICVPLYTINYKDINIPLSLTYDASGIRVDQEASWVGLGWNLMAGGCINRVLSGSYDPSLINASAEAWNTFLTTGSSDINHFMTDLNDNTSLREDIRSGHGERDYYSVNILGKSFLFTVDPFTLECTVIGNEADIYKIEDENNCSYQYLNNAQWKVTDANGVQYFFTSGETTNAFVIGGQFTSTWNLSEIITPEGSVVSFGYSGPQLVNYRAYRHEQYDVVSGGSDASAQYYQNPGYSKQFAQSNVSVNSRYLLFIETYDQKVTFTLGDRTDLPNGKRLEKITVRSKIAQQDIREFNFNYSYFTASTVGGNYLDDHATTTNYSQELGLRLKLNSVTECAGTENLVTSFEYNETYNLPLKTSCAKDFWGYYNGQENSGGSGILSVHTMIPTPLPIFCDKINPLPDIYRTLKGANRYCSENHIQTAVLKKITYPTKGYTCFTYEPHQFITTDNYRYPTTTGYAANRITATVFDSNGQNQTVHKQFVLSADAHGLITVSFHGSLSTLLTSNAKVILSSSTGSTQSFDIRLAPEYDIAYGNSFTKTIPIDLPAATYNLVAICPDVLGNSFSVGASIELTQEFTSSNVPVSTGGGLRIKSIENYNHDGTRQDYISYEYTDRSDVCSGKLLQPLSFADSWHLVFAYQTGPAPGDISAHGYNVHRLKIPACDMPVFFTSLAGGVVGYSTVKQNKYDGSGHLLSSVISDFINDKPQNTWNILHFPDASNGSPKAQSVINADGTKLKQTRYSYSYASQAYRCNAIVFDRVMDMTDWGYSMLSRYDVRLYPFYTSWSKLDGTTETTYYGTDSLVVTNNYTYEPQNHQVRTNTFNASDSGLSYLTEYKYPFDYPGVSPYSLMCSPTYFMLNPVIEQSLSVTEGGNTTQVKLRKDNYTAYTTKYRDTNFLGRSFLLTSSDFKLNGGSTEERLQYTYSNRCDRTGITKDNEKVAYLWAYGSQYPVAEIKGASYSDLTSWGLSTFINNLATKTTTTEVLAVLATIRSSLASRPVLMTSYTYEPLVGISSMTAPNGTVTSYSYDAMGRLLNVRNHNNDIIQQFNYHYK